MANAYDEQNGASDLPQGTATAPQGTATAPQGTATAPQGTATAPQGTATAPQGTATAPQGTATAPQGTATAPQGTATAPQGTAAAPGDASVENVSKGSITELGKVISSGSEGTIYLQPDGKALKVYNPKYYCNHKVLPLVQKLNGKGFLIDLYDFGTKEIQGRMSDFELMQFCPGGPAYKLKNIKGNADAILKIALYTATALDACHKAGFIHKDVKPANILILDEKTLACRLCDFGIADLLNDGESITPPHRTKIYTAPEMYDPENVRYIPGAGDRCRLTPAADFYSLGMTILSLWLGESALMTQEEEQAFQKKDGFEVPKDMPEPLRTITQGLLVSEPDDRWGLQEIKDKMAGKDVKIVKRMKIVYSSEKKQTAHSLEELAAFMVEDLNIAKRYIYTDILSDWLKPKPELQAQIKEIIKATQKDQDFGCLQILHILNPLYDLGLFLAKQPGDPDYAMYDKGIGEMLNKAYYLYFNKYESNYKLMTQKWDKDDALLFPHPLVAYQIAHSFENSSEQDYLSWFLNEKNQRLNGGLTQQINFYTRMKEDEDRKKKNGYKDKSYLSQVKMMRTISGFNAPPTYRIDGTDTLLKSIDDYNSAPSGKMQEALRNDKGIRGWLAVMFHENPHVKPGKREEHKFDVLLEQYVQAIGHYDSNNREYKRFITAQQEAKDVTSNAKAQIRKVYTNSTVQKVLTAVLAFFPAVILLISVILNALDNPVLNMEAVKNNWVFYGIGIVIAIAVYFTFFAGGTGGCILSVIIGAVASAIMVVLLKFLGEYLLWIYAAAVFAVIVLFSIKALFKKSPFALKAKSIMNPGFGELTLAPLEFAFNDDNEFEPINNGLDPETISTWKTDVKDRWKTVIIFILIVWGLIACSTFLPKSSRMNHFNRQMQHSAATLFSNDSIPMEEEEELQPELNGDGTTVPFVKPKERGIIRQ
ncbi:MAG: protein kinase [Bacteroidales bacterium]|nr:protein kinase [Bacteroidales bacterium]